MHALVSPMIVRSQATVGYCKLLWVTKVLTEGPDNHVQMIPRDSLSNDVVHEIVAW